MKNTLIVITLTLLFITNVFAGPINSYISEGYKIVNEETISANDTLYFNKVFTLKKKNNILICTVRFSGSGNLRDVQCIEP